MDWGAAIGILLGIAGLAGRRREQQPTLRLRATMARGVLAGRGAVPAAQITPSIRHVVHAVWDRDGPRPVHDGTPAWAQIAIPRIPRYVYAARGAAIVYTYRSGGMGLRDVTQTVLCTGWHGEPHARYTPAERPIWVEDPWLDEGTMDTTLYPYAASAIVPLPSDAIADPGERMVASWIAALRVWRPHIRYVRWEVIDPPRPDARLAVWAYEPGREHRPRPGLWDQVQALLRIGGAIASVVAPIAVTVAPGLLATLQRWATRVIGEVESTAQSVAASLGEIWHDVQRLPSRIMDALPIEEIERAGEQVAAIGEAIIARTGIDALEVAERARQDAVSWLRAQTERLTSATHLAVDAVLHGSGHPSRGLVIRGVILCDGAIGG